MMAEVGRLKALYSIEIEDRTLIAIGSLILITAYLSLIINCHMSPDIYYFRNTFEFIRGNFAVECDEVQEAAQNSSGQFVTRAFS